MLSVIVPVYNAAGHLPNCIESILGQSYDNLELILVDDGSQDRSLEICREYEQKDSRVRVFTQENRGVAAARNRGLALARGEYIQFADSDDFVLQDMCRSMISTMEETGTELVICGWEEHCGRECVVRCPSIAGVVAASEIRIRYPNIFEMFMLNAVWNKLYRRERIRAEFPEELSMGEDLLFNLQYLQQVKTISFLQQPLYCYQREETGLSSIQRKDTIEIARRLYRANMEMSEAWGMEEPARTHISTIFVKFFIHGISTVYKDPQRSTREKKTVLLKWMEDPELQQALASARMPQLRQRTAQFLMRHRLVFFMHHLMLLNR